MKGKLTLIFGLIATGSILIGGIYSLGQQTQRLTEQEQKIKALQANYAAFLIRAGKDISALKERTAKSETNQSHILESLKRIEGKL